MSITFNSALVFTLVLLFVWLVVQVCSFLKNRLSSRSRRRNALPLYFSFAVVAVCIFVLRYPYYAAQHPDTLDPVDFALLSFLDVFRYFTMNIDFSPLHIAAGSLSFADPAWQYFPPFFKTLASPAVYQMADIILMVSAPICTLTAIFSLFKAFFKRIGLHLLCYRRVYYFSALNEKSFTMAKSLYEDWRRRWFLIPKQGMGPKDNWFHPRKRRPALVFCQVDSDDGNDTEVQFRADAEAMGAIFYEDPIQSVYLVPRWRKVSIFLMDENEDTNILSLLKMKDKLIHIPLAERFRNYLVSARLLKEKVTGKEKESGKEKKPVIPHSDIYVFSTQESTELLFDNLLDELNGIPADRHNFSLHLIDETELIVQKLLLDHPLYEPLYYLSKAAADGKTSSDDSNLISVLAIGGGLLGMELVRGAMICGITDSYNFEIQVIDKNADELKKQFCFISSHLNQEQNGEAAGDTKISPIIGGNSGISSSVIPKFHQADCRTTDFEKVLKDHCSKSNYIVIATGDDELNISTARFLQRWYAREDIKRGEVPSRPPMIFAAIRNTERHKALKALELDDRHEKSKQLFLFGCNEDIFSPEGILDRQLDASAALFNECYGNADRLKVQPLCTPPNQRQHMRCALFKLHQVQRFSNQIVAMHSLYKLQDLLHTTDTPNALLDYRYAKEKSLQGTQDLFRKMAELIQNQGEQLLRLEHNRWNLFYVLDGWECFPKEMIPACKKAGYTPKPRKPHQLPLIKLHGCLVPFDELNAVSDACEKEPREFKDFDACMCCASLFAWLDLEADPVHAEQIRAALLEQAKATPGSEEPCFSCNELLDLIIETFSPKKS